MYTAQIDICQALEILINAPIEELRRYHEKVRLVCLNLQKLSINDPIFTLPNQNRHEQEGHEANSTETSVMRSSHAPADCRNCSDGYNTGRVHSNQPLLALDSVQEDADNSSIPRECGTTISGGYHAGNFPGPLQTSFPLPENCSGGPGNDSHELQSESLIEMLRDRYHSIKVYLNKEPSDAVCGGTTWLDEDPRIVELCMSEKDGPSDQLTYRKQLSRRSLAKDFIEWEREKFKTSRVQQLVENPSDKGSQGHLRTFLEESSGIINKNRAFKGIRHGIKLLFIETQLGLSGISALLAFTFTNFRDLNYEKVPPFVRRLQHCRDLLDLAQQKTSWFETCVEYYESMFYIERLNASTNAT